MNSKNELKKGISQGILNKTEGKINDTQYNPLQKITAQSPDNKNFDINPSDKKEKVGLRKIMNARTIEVIY